MFRRFRAWCKSLTKGEDENQRLQTSFINGQSRLDNRGAELRGCSAQIRGEGNSVLIRKGSKLENCRFIFFGSHNVVEIGEGCLLKGVTFWIENNNNSVRIGNRTKFYGSCQLAAMEGVAINIGSNCLFAPDIYVRSGDSHSILNSEGERITPSAGITISDHVWVGHRVIITKGVSIARDCVIGTAAVVTRSVAETNCIAAGVPAKIVKRNISWDDRRL